MADRCALVLIGIPKSTTTEVNYTLVKHGPPCTAYLCGYSTMRLLCYSYVTDIPNRLSTGAQAAEVKDSVNT